MDLKVQLINALRNELSGESALVLERNIKKRPIISAEIDDSTSSKVKYHIPSVGKSVGGVFGNAGRVIQGQGNVIISNREAKAAASGCFDFSLVTLLLIFIVIIIAIGLLFYFGGKFVSSTFNLNLFISILIEFAAIMTTALIIYLVIKLVKYTYSVFDNKINSIQTKSVEVKDGYNDDVYSVISSTYETLCDFRKERERQAKNSFNVALSLVIVGVLIVFGGVFLLFKKNIVEGVLSSTVGSISSIIGGTIIKLYKDTNDRMDKLNTNLSTLNYAKVQYALILKINDEKKRDVELSMLIKSIGKISQ